MVGQMNEYTAHVIPTYRMCFSEHEDKIFQFAIKWYVGVTHGTIRFIASCFA